VWSQVSLQTGERQYVREVRPSEPLAVRDFPELVESVAAVSFYNPEYALFFRGQPRDYTVTEGSTIMPSMFRLNGVGRQTKRSKRMVRDRFTTLQRAEEYLIEEFEKRLESSSGRLRQFSEVAWSILQHYEVTDTPLLDVTTSLRVAASFATESGARDGVLMVLGMPHPHGSISYYVEEQLANVRLLSICPPEACRPFYQEGFVASTFPVRHPEVRGSNHDFARRLIAKFLLPKGVWSKDFPPIPQAALFPSTDAMLPVVQAVKQRLGDDV